jgi:thermitase
VIPSRHLARLSVLLLLLLCGRGSQCAYAHRLTTCVPGEVLVGLFPECEGPLAVSELEAAAGMEVGRQPALCIHRLHLRPGVSMLEALDRLRQIPGVRFAEPNSVLCVDATPNDPYFPTSQWGPQRVQADRAWEIWQPQAPVVIAIVDTGIDGTHPDLAQKIYRDATGIVGYDAFTGQRDDAVDGHWHGTHCAGIAAAQVNNGLGIAGIAGWNGVADASDTAFVKLMPVKVLDNQGMGDSLTVANGILWAADHGARVISLSLGSTAPSSAIANAVQYARGKGCVIVAAAGNEGSTTKSYPAAYPGVIAVAATDRGDRLTSFTSYGSWVPVAAPGAGITSTMPTYQTSLDIPLDYAAASGTSMACPHVAGEAALILAQNPALTNSQVDQLITTNVDAYTTYQGRMLATGGGRINVYRALQVARGATPSLTSLSLNPTTVTGGTPSTGKVSLSAPAPANGAVVLLKSADTATATVPASVTVAAGATTATFTVTTKAVAASRSVTLSATYDGLTRTASLSVQPPALASVTVSPTRVTGGTSATGKVALNGPAPAGGVVIKLSSARVSNPSAGAPPATVPASVTVPAGATSVSFSITTKRVTTATGVKISATLGSLTATATLTVAP